MLKSKQKFRIETAGLLRQLLLSWLFAATVEFLLLPAQYRDLTTLVPLDGMSGVRVLLLTAASFALLVLASQFAETVRLERWLMTGTFAVLMVTSLCSSFSPVFLGSSVLCLLLLLIYAWKGQAPMTQTAMPLPPERGKRPALCLTAAAALAFFAFVSLWTVCRVLAYRSPTYDFSIFSQMFHHMRTTGAQTTTLERDGLLSHFAVHVSPIYYLLLPFYCLFPRPETLQVLQAALLTSAAIPLWLLAKKHGFSPMQRALFCLVLFLYPAYSGGMSFDFHENAFLTPLLFWLFYAIDRESRWLTALFAVLTLMVKEDAAVYVAVAGIYLAIRSIQKPCDRKGGLLGLALLLGSVLWFIGVTTYLTRYGDGVMSYRYINLMPKGSLSLLSVIKTVLLLPMKALFECSEGGKLKFIALTILPLLGLPLVTRKYERLLLLIPYILINLLSDYPYQHDINFQYTFGAMAFLFYLMLLNLSDLPKRSLLLWLCAAVALASFCSTTMKVGLRYPVIYWENREEYAQTDEFLQNIPDDAAVAATTFYTTRLSNREILYDIKFASKEHILSAEYVLLDTDDTPSYWEFSAQGREDGLEQLIAFLSAHGYTEIDRLDDRLILYQKPQRTGQCR